MRIVAALLRKQLQPRVYLAASSKRVGIGGYGDAARVELR